MLRYKTDKTSFSHLLRHLARKRSGSILTTPKSSRGTHSSGSQSFLCPL